MMTKEEQQYLTDIENSLVMCKIRLVWYFILGVFLGLMGQFIVSLWSY